MSFQLVQMFGLCNSILILKLICKWFTEGKTDMWHVHL